MNQLNEDLRLFEPFPESLENEDDEDLNVNNDPELHIYNADARDSAVEDDFSEYDDEEQDMVEIVDPIAADVFINFRCCKCECLSKFDVAVLRKYCCQVRKLSESNKNLYYMEY